jgi:FkbH-like protein
VKCLIWDLDNTLWSGTLSEGDDVVVTTETIDLIKELDRRGVLQSIASRNTHEDAYSKLSKLNLAEYFVEPRINWGNKSSSVDEIQKALNIGIDSIGFVDDQEFERQEVAFQLPGVRCYDVAELPRLLGYDEFNQRFVTVESGLRRQMYLQDKAREEASKQIVDPEAFARTLELKVQVALATLGDLERVEELTLRTNQLNASGYIYSFDELAAFLNSPNHILLTVEATDRFGSYGKVGAALIETRADSWTVKLLLVSCRVMSRGVGGIFLRCACAEAARRGLQLNLEYRPTERNRAVLITIRFAGFSEVATLEDRGSLMRWGGLLPPAPKHVSVATPWDSIG